jgi:hypothetical protein
VFKIGQASIDLLKHVTDPDPVYMYLKEKVKGKGKSKAILVTGREGPQDSET